MSVYDFVIVSFFAVARPWHRPLFQNFVYARVRMCACVSVCVFAIAHQSSSKSRYLSDFIHARGCVCVRMHAGAYVCVSAGVCENGSGMFPHLF